MFFLYGNIYKYHFGQKVCVEEFRDWQTFRAWIFNILSPGEPVLLLDSTKQWSVAMEAVNASTLCRKEQNKRQKFCMLCYHDWA